MSNYDYGHAPTAHKKSSTKKTPKKGTGKGVCQVTKKKHRLTGVHVYGPYRFRENDSKVFLVAYKVCEDCQGVGRSEYLSADDVRALRLKFREIYGMDLKDAPAYDKTAPRIK